jgi:hypothetical protein
LTRGHGLKKLESAENAEKVVKPILITITIQIGALSCPLTVNIPEIRDEDWPM